MSLEESYESYIQMADRLKEETKDTLISINAVRLKMLR